MSKPSQFAGTLTELLLVLPLLLIFVDPPACSQVPQHSHHEHRAMSTSTDRPTQSMLLSWKRESEGNHHLIGLFVALSGLFLLAQGGLGKKFTILGYAWPTCFLLSGFFVLAYSDTELWPFGPKPWIQGTITNPEVIQHKIFAVLLLAVGVLEIGRESFQRCLGCLVFSCSGSGRFTSLTLPLSQYRDARHRPHGNYGAYSG